MKNKLIKLLTLSLLITTFISCDSKETKVARTCTINGVSVDPSQCDGITTPTASTSNQLTEELNGFATITIPIDYDFESNTFEVSRDSYATTQMDDYYQCIAGLKAGEYQVDLIENQKLSLDYNGVSSEVNYESSIGYTEDLAGTIWYHLFETVDNTMNAKISIESNLNFNEELSELSIKVFCDAIPM